MRFANFVPYAMKTSVIRITSYENKIIRGVLSNPFYDTDIEFNGMFPLVLLLENLQDELNYPQRSMDARSFSGDGKLPELIETPAGEITGNILATFQISVYFRQNASWQGSIVWAERKQSANFRSVLELMMLMDSALSGGEHQENEPPDSSGTSQKSGQKGISFCEKDD